MNDQTPSKMDPPTPGVPVTLGILNVTFAAVLLLCCTGTTLFNTFAQPKFDNAVREALEKEKVKQADARQATLESLAKHEAEAKDEEEKVEIRAKRKEIETRPVPAMPAMPDAKALGMETPKFIAFTWTDLVT